MRKILFRGKSTTTGKWHEGSLLKVTLDGTTYSLIFGDNFLRAGMGVEALQHSCVYPETVGQYTGLRDKNSERIFEGDIVQINEHETAVNGLYCVQWSESNSCWTLQRNEEYHHHFFTFSDLNGFAETSEIVGNIHDNPELMK